MVNWLVVWNMAFIFPNSWDDDPIWLMFFRGVESTNQWGSDVNMGMNILWGYVELATESRWVFLQDLCTKGNYFFLHPEWWCSIHLFMSSHGQRVKHGDWIKKIHSLHVWNI
jgi:hypothetical protein